MKNRLERDRRVVECDKSLEEVELVQLLGNSFLFDNLTVGQPMVMKAWMTQGWKMGWDDGGV